MNESPNKFFENAVTLSGSINTSSLARKIGVSRQALGKWKKGISYPSDATMIKIADLCKLDPAECLALLNLWRCNEEAKTGLCTPPGRNYPGKLAPGRAVMRVFHGLFFRSISRGWRSRSKFVCALAPFHWLLWEIICSYSSMRRNPVNWRLFQ